MLPRPLPLVVMLCAAACGGDPAPPPPSDAATVADTADSQVVDAAPLDAPAADTSADAAPVVDVPDVLADVPCRGACGPLSVCVRGACVEPCGAAGRYVCGAACVDTATDANNCGACGRACVAMESTVQCIAGECRVESCTAGRADCDGDAANGCEVLLNNSAMNCGACGRACSAATRGRGVCSMGACALACDTGFGDCDSDASNGCETSTTADATNCGACGNRCGGTRACVAGACR